MKVIFCLPFGTDLLVYIYQMVDICVVEDNALLLETFR